MSSTVALLSSDEALNLEIKKVLDPMGETFDYSILKNKSGIMNFLSYELPEINIIHWNDVAWKAEDLVGEMKKDPWLHFGASIIIQKGENEADLTKRVAGINLLSVIDRGRVSYYLPRVLEALKLNRSMLTQWNFHTLVQSKLSGILKLQEDAFDLITHANLLVNFLFNSNLVGKDERERLYVVLVELMMKTVSLVGAQSGAQLELEYRIDSQGSTFKLKPSAPAFVWEKLPTIPPQSGLKLDLSSDAKVLTMQVEHNSQKAGILPQFSSQQQQVEFKDGETVFTQGEESNHIFYIVAGQFEILANGKRVSILTPTDVFLGEMSFLLKNR